MKTRRRRWVGVLFCALLTAAPIPAKGAPFTQWEKGTPGVETPYESADSISSTASRAMATEGRRSPGRAFLYSFFGTAIPVGVGGGTALGNNELSAGALVAIGGAVVGPSLGHFYAQRPGRAIRGIVARGVAAGMITGAVYSSSESAFTSLFVGGSLLGIGFFVADIAGAPHSADVHNEEVARARVSAALFAGPIGGAPGVGLRLAF
jgi:hypothetical protein